MFRRALLLEQAVTGRVGWIRSPWAAWSLAASWGLCIDTGVNGWPLNLRVPHILKLLYAKKERESKENKLYRKIEG